MKEAQMAKEETEKVVAFVLVRTEIGKEYDVVEKILELSEKFRVNAEAYVVYGEYDVAAKIVAESLRNVDKVVTAIRSIQGVLRTVTLIASSP